MSDIGSYGESLYQQVQPIHGPDPDGLAHDYVGAVAHPFREVDELVRDTPEGIGWSVILDVDAAPVKGLPWLGQIAGVKLRRHRWLNSTENMLPGGSFETSIGGWGNGSNGTFARMMGSTTDGNYFGRMTVNSDGSDRSVAMFVSFPVDAGVTYTFSADIVTFNVASSSARIRMQWMESGTPMVEYTEATFTGTGRASCSGISPVTAEAVQLEIVIPVAVTADIIDFDALRLVKGTASTYVDGSYLGFEWESTIHGSATLINRMETEAEWAAYARDAIKRQGGKQRGTVDAILSAAEGTLTGTRIARILERVGGNAWALELITRPSETPDPAATLAAATLQKPAGMSLSHTMTEGLLIDEDTGGTIDTAGGTIDTPTD